MEIFYRLATLEDLPAMERAGDKVFDHSIKADRAREFLKDERHHLILAYDHDEIVGMASGFHYVHPDKDPILFINEVGVLEEYQNQGIGREVVRLLCEHGKAIGCKESWVMTDVPNTAARKAFVAAGGHESKDRFVMIEYEE